MEKITTRTVGVGFAETEETILLETPTTVIVFKSQIHEKGIRGWIIRYKKDNKGNRAPKVPVDFKQLHAGEGVAIELKTEAVLNLLQCIQQRQTILSERGVEFGTHEYKIADADDLIVTDQNKSIVIRKLLEAKYGEDVWAQLKQDNPDVATRLAYSQLYENRMDGYKRFEEMLADNSHSEEDWQSFFENNTWIFGYGLCYQFLNVIQPQPYYGGTGVDRSGGQRGDFLTATAAKAKFTCLVEIKKPTTALLRQAKYRNGAWGISEELAGAISQVQVNCAQWEIEGSRSERTREQLTNIYTISPRGIVVIGNSSELDDYDKKIHLNVFEENYTIRKL